LKKRSSSFVDSDSEGDVMAQEIEEIVLRTPGFSENLSPKMPSDQEKTSVASIQNSDQQCGVKLESKSSLSKKKLRRKSPSTDKGSQFVYGLVTPSKKVQLKLDSKSVVSPIRRSMRIKHEEIFYENLDDIPNLPEHGYLPNPAISLKHRRRHLSHNDSKGPSAKKKF
jgi:hypothetical protein